MRRDPSYEAALTGLCERYGGSPDQRVLAELSREYRSRATRAFEQIDPEIISIVATLREHGFRLGVITDSSDLDTAPWIESEFAPYFDDLVASHEIGSLKRAQKTFSIACQRLDVHPSDAIFVGDGGGNELGFSQALGTRRRTGAPGSSDRWPEGRRPGKLPGRRLAAV
ncbi:MAG: HAD hydrolase-like protein [Thermomicrobiales bacterium]